MRIAHVISTPEGFGGAERVTISLIEAALDEGHEVVLFNPFAIEPTSSQLRVAAESVDYRGRPLRGVLDLSAVRRWLRAELAGFGPDIVHAHLFHAAALTASLPKICPRLLTHHHGAVFERLRRPWKRALDRAVGKRFDRVVAVSSSVERFLIDSYGYSSERVTTIPNGWIGEPVEAQPEDHPVMICAGNLRAEKMHSVLVDAMVLVRASFPRARLLLLGDGPLRSQLEDQAERLGLADFVDFRGLVADVWDWYSRADVAVMPSGYEGLGIAALDAMAAGLPVVATRVGGLPELVVDGETGILIPPGDPGAMAEAIVKLIASPDESRRMGEAGRARAEKFSMKKMTDAYLQLYEEVTRGRG